MATITPSLSTVTNGIGKSEVLFRFVGGRDFIFRIKSGIFTTPNRWNDADHHLIIPRIGTAEQRELLQTQKQLNDLSTLIIESFTLQDKSKINKAWFAQIVDKFHHPDKYETESLPQLVECMPNFIERQKFSDIRRRNFYVLYRALKRFEIYKNTVLILSEVTADNLHDFELFLRDEHALYKDPANKFIYDACPESRTPALRGQNTISTMLIMLRVVFNWANNEGLTTNYPFKNFVIPECVYGPPYYITIDERNRIYKMNLSNHPYVAIQRDVFVFQCLIGCRVGDLIQLKKSNLIDGAIEYVPRKTKEGRPVVVRVPLNSIAKEIIDHYADKTGDALLPFISEQKYNEYIKRIFRAARLYRWVTIINPTTRNEEKVRLYDAASSHLARRTFIGNLYKKVKDPNLVGALSGHKEGSKAFARYRNIDEDMRTELVKLLE